MPSLIEIGQWLRRRRFLNFITVFSLFCNYLAWKMSRLLFWTNLYSLLPVMLCAKFGWNWSCGSEEEDENVKSLRQRWTTDKLLIWALQWRSEKLNWAFRSGDFKTSLFFRNFFSIADWFIFLLAIYDSAVPEACIYPPGLLIRKDSWKKLARMKYFRLILIVHFHIR